MTTFKYDGQLEIDSDRGVIYFHSNYGVTLLRICSLPKPIPVPIAILGGGKVPIQIKDFNPLDISFGYGVNWSPNNACPNHSHAGFAEDVASHGDFSQKELEKET